ncbi:MAG: hypothetical protein WKF31_12010 [Thermoleophilaceae bacterium]
MLDRLVHRGPDDEGSVWVNGSWLGHRRLSIVDVEGGHQPLSTRSGQFHLVGNGEVYNHDEIRATLRDRDYATASDNEVALKLIVERGPARPSATCSACTPSWWPATTAPSSPPAIRSASSPSTGPVATAKCASPPSCRAFDRDWLEDVEVFPPGFYWTPDGGLGASAPPCPRRASTASRARRSPAPPFLSRCWRWFARPWSARSNGR